MACNPPPTATLVETITQSGDSLVTSFSAVTSLFGTVSLTVIPTCIVHGSGTICSVSGVTTRTAIIDKLTTIQVPFTRTVHTVGTVFNPTRTLFGTCAQETQPTLDPTPDPTTTSNTLVVTVITPTVSVSSPYTAQGPPQPYETQGTIPQPQNSPQPTTGQTNIAPIVGGVVGGVLGVAIIAGLIFLWWRRRQRWDDIFEDDDGFNNHAPGAMSGMGSDKNRRKYGVDSGPAQYEYGLVGSQTPPGSPRHTAHHSFTPSHTTQGSQSSAAPLNPPYATGVSPNPNYTFGAPPNTNYPLGPYNTNYSLGPQFNPYSTGPQFNPYSTGSPPNNQYGLPPPQQPMTYPSISPPPTILSSRTEAHSLPQTSSSPRPGSADSQGQMRRRSRAADEVIGVVPIIPRPPSRETASAPVPSRDEKKPMVVMSSGNPTGATSSTPLVVHRDAGRVEVSPPTPLVQITGGSSVDQHGASAADPPPAYS